MQRSNHHEVSKTIKGPEITARTHRKLPPSIVDSHGGLASRIAGLFFWFVQRPHLQNRLITQILTYSHKKGCPFHLFNVSNTSRVIVVLLMSRERADDFEGGIADVDMTGRGAEKYAIRARRYSSYICTLHNVKRLVQSAPGLEVQTSKSGRGGVFSAASGALTGVTVKKLKDFHCRHRISNRSSSKMEYVYILKSMPS